MIVETSPQFQHLFASVAHEYLHALCIEGKLEKRLKSNHRNMFLIKEERV